MSETELRIIKKYPNRRLYDTTISSYITLDDVRRLVIEQVPLKIIDARSQNDITHSTLLQIIIEQEGSGQSLFTIESLQRIIRSYGGSMHVVLSRMFEQGMEFFAEQQNHFKEKTGEWPGKDSLLMMTDYVQKNVSHWQQLQQEWWQSVTSHMQSQQAASTDPEPESDTLQEEIVSDAVGTENNSSVREAD